MEIAFIRETDSKRMRVGVKNGEDVVRYSLSPVTVASLSLERGREIDEAMLELIVREDAEHRAMRRALSLLSYGDNTKKALFIKLLRSGFEREIAEECVAECMRLGYIDERRQIENAVLNEANRALRGKAYIVKKLMSKGYSRADVESVVEDLLDRGEIDFSASFERLCEKKGATGREERRALLYKNGFASSDFD